MGRANRGQRVSAGMRTAALPQEEEIKAVLGNQENQAALLRLLNPNEYVSFAAARREENKLSAILKNWDWGIASDFVRDKWSEKHGPEFIKEARETLTRLRQLAKSMDLDIDRKYRPNEISQREEAVSRRKDGLNKDIVLEHGNRAMAALIKRAYNQTRNDLIEALFVENNPSIIPTLSHTKGVDWLINHQAFDQKVSAVPEGYVDEIQDKLGKDADVAEYIKSHPEEIAKWLYENQDAKRFGAEDRLLIINLGAEETYENLEKAVENTNLEEIHNINFSYSDGESLKKHHSRAIVGFIE